MKSTMHNIIATIIMIGVCLSCVDMAHADDVNTPSACLKPGRPDFQLQSEYADFRQAVRTYERCINTYIDEQEQAAQQHLDAAKKAGEERDQFVNSVLR